MSDHESLGHEQNDKVAHERPSKPTIEETFKLISN